jgi:hypothetical protein
VGDGLDVEVIGQVAAQKNDGSAKRRNHAVAMRGLIFALDEYITRGQENRAEAVKRSVDGGQIVDSHDTFPKTK